MMDYATNPCIANELQAQQFNTATVFSKEKAASFKNSDYPLHDQ